MRSGVVPGETPPNEKARDLLICRFFHAADVAPSATEAAADATRAARRARATDGGRRRSQWPRPRGRRAAGRMNVGSGPGRDRGRRRRRASRSRGWMPAETGARSATECSNAEIGSGRDRSVPRLWTSLARSPAETGSLARSPCLGACTGRHALRPARSRPLGPPEGGPGGARLIGASQGRRTGRGRRPGFHPPPRRGSGDRDGSREGTGVVGPRRGCEGTIPLGSSDLLAC